MRAPDCGECGSGVMQCRGECYWLAEVSLCLHSEVFSAPPYLMITSEGPTLQRHPAVWGFYTLSHTDWQSKTRLGWTRQTADNQTFHYFADVSPDTDGMEYISNNKVFSVEDAIITRNNTARSNWKFVIGQGKDERLLTDPTIHVRWVYVKKDKGTIEYRENEDESTTVIVQTASGESGASGAAAPPVVPGSD